MELSSFSSCCWRCSLLVSSPTARSRRGSTGWNGGSTRSEQRRTPATAPSARRSCRACRGRRPSARRPARSALERQSEPEPARIEEAAARRRPRRWAACSSGWWPGRLLIWLGGIALVLAAVFLIRYSIEIGLMTPARADDRAPACSACSCSAPANMRGAGRLADDPRIAQALVGAGIAVLYATAYGSHVLYGLIDSRTALRRRCWR